MIRIINSTLLKFWSLSRLMLVFTSFLETFSTNCTILASLSCFPISVSRFLRTPARSVSLNFSEISVGIFCSTRDESSLLGTQSDKSGPLSAHWPDFVQRHRAKPRKAPGQSRRTSEPPRVSGHVTPD